jgi:predicted permease
MVLVIAAANVANLLLACSTARKRELALRSSLGAGRGRLLRQHLTESLLLALSGGIAGLLIAYWGNALVRQFPVPPSAGRLDARILGFALAVSLFTGLLFGLLPALRASRVDPTEGLKEGKSMASRGRGRTRRALIVLQVAMSLVLLVGAGLFVRSLRAVYTIDAGIDVDGLMAVSMDLSRAGIPKAARPEVYREALERLRQVPGVSHAALVQFVPFGGTTMSVPFRVEGRDTAGRMNMAVMNVVRAGYLESAGTRVLAGRGFNVEDASGEPVAVVNSILAREIAPGGNAVGHCAAFGSQEEDGGCTRIVGVVEETRGVFLIPQEQPQYYVSWDRKPDAISWGTPALLVRLKGASPGSAEAIRAAVQGLQPDLPYVQVQPLKEKIRNDLLPYRLGATLFSLFALIALMLAAIGVYGVLAYFVTERTPEIGVRRAIGAPRRAVLTLVIRQGMSPVVVGLGIGLAVAFAGSSLIGSLLFGVDARDPLTFAAVAVFLVAVALLATLLPAWRATRVDPMIALRHE